jgi:hypothetical protein
MSSRPRQYSCTTASGGSLIARVRCSQIHGQGQKEDCCSSSFRLQIFRYFIEPLRHHNHKMYDELLDVLSRRGSNRVNAARANCHRKKAREITRVSRWDVENIPSSASVGMNSHSCHITPSYRTLRAELSCSKSPAEKLPSNQSRVWDGRAWSGGSEWCKERDGCDSCSATATDSPATLGHRVWQKRGEQLAKTHRHRQGSAAAGVALHRWVWHKLEVIIDSSPSQGPGATFRSPLR